MIKTKKQKIVISSLIVTAVISLTIGFSYFASNLIISTIATFTPSSENFKIVFSKDSSKVQIGNVTPVVTGSATAHDIIIDNTTTTTLDDISATFKKPGDKVVYNLYTYNISQYDVYLTNIIFSNVEGKNKFKICTADDPVLQPQIDDICNSIKLTLDIGSTIATQSQIEQGHVLLKNKSELLVVTIEYLSSANESVGPFTVDFGDISLMYSTADISTSTS